MASNRPGGGMQSPVPQFAQRSRPSDLLRQSLTNIAAASSSPKPSSYSMHPSSLLSVPPTPPKAPASAPPPPPTPPSSQSPSPVPPPPPPPKSTQVLSSIPPSSNSPIRCPYCSYLVFGQSKLRSHIDNSPICFQQEQEELSYIAYQQNQHKQQKLDAIEQREKEQQQNIINAVGSAFSYGSPSPLVLSSSSPSSSSLLAPIASPAPAVVTSPSRRPVTHFIKEVHSLRNQFDFEGGSAACTAICAEVAMRVSENPRLMFTESMIDTLIHTGCELHSSLSIPPRTSASFSGKQPKSLAVSFEELAKLSSRIRQRFAILDEVMGPIAQAGCFLPALDSMQRFSAKNPSNIIAGMLTRQPETLLVLKWPDADAQSHHSKDPLSISNPRTKRGQHAVWALFDSHPRAVSSNGASMLYFDTAKDLEAHLAQLFQPMRTNELAENELFNTFSLIVFKDTRESNAAAVITSAFVSLLPSSQSQQQQQQQQQQQPFAPSPSLAPTPTPTPTKQTPPPPNAFLPIITASAAPKQPPQPPPPSAATLLSASAGIIIPPMSSSNSPPAENSNGAASAASPSRVRFSDEAVSLYNKQQPAPPPLPSAPPTPSFDASTSILSHTFLQNASTPSSSRSIVASTMPSSAPTPAATTPSRRAPPPPMNTPATPSLVPAAPSPALLSFSAPAPVASENVSVDLLQAFQSSSSSSSVAPPPPPSPSPSPSHGLRPAPSAQPPPLPSSPSPAVAKYQKMMQSASKPKPEPKQEPAPILPSSMEQTAALANLMPDPRLISHFQHLEKKLTEERTSFDLDKQERLHRFSQFEKQLMNRDIELQRRQEEMSAKMKELALRESLLEEKEFANSRLTEELRTREIDLRDRESTIVLFNEQIAAREQVLMHEKTSIQAASRVDITVIVAEWEARLEQQKQMYEAELAKLQQTISLSSDENSSADTSARIAKTALMTMQREKEETEERNRRNLEVIRALEMQIHQMDLQIQDQHKTIAMLEMTSGDANSSMIQSAMSVDARESLVSDREKAVAEFEHGLDQRRQAVEEREMQVERLGAALQEHAAILQEKLNGDNSDAAASQQRITELEQLLYDVQKQLQESDDLYIEMEKEAAKYRDQVEQQELEVTVLRRELENSQKMNQALDQQFDDLQIHVDRARKNKLSGVLLSPDDSQMSERRSYAPESSSAASAAAGAIAETVPTTPASAPMPSLSFTVPSTSPGSVMKAEVQQASFQDSLTQAALSISLVRSSNSSNNADDLDLATRVALRKQKLLEQQQQQQQPKSDNGRQSQVPSSSSSSLSNSRAASPLLSPSRDNVINNDAIWRSPEKARALSADEIIANTTLPSADELFEFLESSSLKYM